MAKGKLDFDKVGKKNKTRHENFVTMCKASQPVLKAALADWLKKIYGEVVVDDGYVYAKGNCPVLLTAHLDTVHKERVKDFYEYKSKAIGDVLSSPQGIGGDDRCGVYMITEIIARLGMLPSVLFCEDEEIGGIGSNKFVKSEHIKDLEQMLFLVELDRANAKDLVFYDDENYDFHEFCETEMPGYKESWGSFSDISHLCPACGVSGVNVSCGYYNPHTTSEYVVFDEMEESIVAVMNLIREGVDKGKRYEYVERKRWSYLGESTKGYEYGYDYGYYEFKLKNGELCYVEGMSEVEALGWFMLDNPDKSYNDIDDYYQIA